MDVSKTQSFHLSATEIEQFKKIFLKQLRELEIERESNVLEFASRNQPGNQDVDGDEIDMLIEQRDQGFVYRLLGRRGLFEKKIKDALRRIEEGRYGVCEECGTPISYSRLKARPVACLCLNCKEEEEREENSIIYCKRSKSLGAELSRTAAMESADQIDA